MICFTIMISVLLPFSCQLVVTESPEQFLQEAAESRQRVEQAQQAMDESLDALFLRLETAIDSINPDDFLGERMAIAELRKIVSKLRVESAEIVSAHTRFKVAAESYGAVLDQARPLILEAARTFKAYSQEESFHDIAAQYVMVAESFTAIAVKYEQKRVRIRPSIVAVATNLTYVERTSLLLERLDKFLVVMPDDGPDTTQFLNNLSQYIAAFEMLREQLTAFHKATAQKLSDGSPAMPRHSESLPETSLKEDADKPNIPIGVPIDSAPNGSAPKKNKVRPKQRLRPRKPYAINVPLKDRHTGQLPPSVAKNSSLDLTGKWSVAGSQVVFLMEQEGDSVSILLRREPKGLYSYGTLRLQNGLIKVEQLFYYTPTSGMLDLGDTVWRIRDHDHIECTGPHYKQNSVGKYVRTGTTFTYSLHRS